MDESALTSIAATLWRERQELEDLLFALTSQQLIISAGQTRWLARADAQLELAMTSFRESEVLRAIEIDAAAQQLGLTGDVTLGDIADACSEPWSTTFAEHRTALRGLMAEVKSGVAENERLLRAGSQAVQDTLSNLGSFVSTYNAKGGSVRDGDRPTFLDEQA